MKRRGQLKIPSPEKDSPLKAKEKQNALKISIKEGSAATISGGTGDSYITPFALNIGASPLQIGYISSLSGLLNPLAQLFGARLMETRSRKKIVERFVLLQALLWLPIAFLAFLFWKGIFTLYAVPALIILYTLTIISVGIASPAWFSWMGDIVPPESKGNYFARRNRVTGAIGLVASLSAAFLLDAFKTKGLALIGFTILFSLAFLFRFISFLFFTKQFNPKFKLRKDSYFSVWALIKRYDNFGKFVVYKAVFEFAIMIASPFFAVYMLQELKFNYATFMAITTASTIFYLLFTPLVGKFSDRFGNKRLLYASGILFAATPLLWIFLKNPIALIALPQLISGLANATHSIPATNFIYDSVSQQKRALCSAYLNLLTGVGTFFGSILGGIIATSIHISSISPFLAVFALASIARLSATLYFLPKIKDSKRTRKLPAVPFDLNHPLKTAHSDISWFRVIFK